MTPQVEIQLIAVVTAAACSLVGTFLVLRRMAMMSDAISHSILLGLSLIHISEPTRLRRSRMPSSA